MTAFLRNTLLAAIAMSSLAGTAMADETKSCSHTNLNDLWAGNCCSAAGTSDCLRGGNGGNGGRDHGDNGGRGTNGNGGAAGKP